MIERIHFEDDKFNYNSLEASIHLARYQVAKQFVCGKRVLDIACGEGYGSLLMKQWGAKNVTGIDIDLAAIKSANRHFVIDGVSFICGDAETLTSDDKFDVIVSLETMEHVENEQTYLSKLQSVLAKDGVLIISCPNDHWYFSENESNPYHLRKYTFQDFVKSCAIVLGDADQWLIGSNIFGYANYPYNPKTDSIEFSKEPLLPKDIISSDLIDGCIVLNDNRFLPNQIDSLYYIGIWGKTSKFVSASVFSIKPIRADVNAIDALMNSCKLLQDDIKIKNAYIKDLEISKSILHEDVKVKMQYIQDLETSRGILQNNIEIKSKYIQELEDALFFYRSQNG